MAIYHMQAKVVSRGKGRSAVAASAYMSCSSMTNEYDGVHHDYTRKKGLVWEQVFLPENAPVEWQDRAILWNAVEDVEKSKDSRLAREFVVALPRELNADQQIVLLTEYIQQQFVADGMCADVGIHDPDPTGHNPHAHILLTIRPLDEQGKWQYKTEKEYLCIRGNEERGFTAAEFLHAQDEGWEKQYPYLVGKKKIYMTTADGEAQGFYFCYGRHIKLGKNTYINVNCNFVDDGMITIGENVLFGPAVTIATVGHPLKPTLREYMYTDPVTIGNNVWIGAGAVICPGVTIGNGSVIGAGSVVNKDVPANSIAAGNPCRVIREIDDRDDRFYYRDRPIDPEDLAEEARLRNG